MKTMRSDVIWIMPICIVCALLLSACSDSASDLPPAPEEQLATYEITITNLTSNQPFSPPALVFHTAGYDAWELGAPASDGLEVLAEAGDATEFLGEAMANTSVVGTAEGTGIIVPGGSDTIEFETELRLIANLLFSFATMLVNTNDAFTGMTHTAIDDLGINQSMTLFTRSYDSGTEANSESAPSVPGPAGGGEGFNPDRDDNDYVAVHSGVVTFDDGLLSSALGESHRWLHPVARVVLTRTE